MRVLVLFAHPVETSFHASLHRACLTALEAAGHQVDDCDLYAEAFNPILSREERLAYHDVPANRETVSQDVERLLRAEALVLIYPVWNYGFPAILKGYFDRVFLPGVTFEMVDGKVHAALSNIRSLAVVTTYGGTRLRSWLVGDPPRRLVTRMLRATIAPGARVRYYAQYDLNRSTGKCRSAFLNKVVTAMRDIG